MLTIEIKDIGDVAITEAYIGCVLFVTGQVLPQIQDKNVCLIRNGFDTKLCVEVEPSGEYNITYIVREEDKNGIMLKVRADDIESEEIEIQVFDCFDGMSICKKHDLYVCENREWVLIKRRASECGYGGGK